MRLQREAVVRPSLVLALLFAVGAALPALAQDDSTVGLDAMGVQVADKSDTEIQKIGKWHVAGQLGVNLLQSSFTDNWNGGDTGAVSWGANFKISAENQFHQKWNWFNRLRLAYGQIHQQERVGPNSEQQWQEPTKTDDEIDLESVARYMPGNRWNPYFSFRFQSLFQDINDPFGRSIAFNPLDFREAIGMSRSFVERENEVFVGRLGAALRQSSRKFYFEPPEVGDATSRTNSNDGGLELRFDYNGNVLHENINWISRFTLYQPLFYSTKDQFDQITAEDRDTYGLGDDIADYPLVVDVDWQNIFSTNVTKVIAVVFEIRWIYDKYDNSVVPEFDEDGNLINGFIVNQAVRKAGQFKQVLQLGLAYNF